MDANNASELTSLAADVLKRRAESLAAEQAEDVAEDLVSLLAFQLGEEWYAVGIEHVREIYNEFEVTPVPCVPPHIRGVINIRGEIISVTALAALMGVGTSKAVEGESAIVVQNDDCVTAMVVDAISDIIEVPQDAVEPPVAALDKGQTAEFVTGSVYVDGRLVAVINPNKVLEPIGATA